MTALRALLAGIVDYAGLFPPAALDMATAVRNYAEYQANGDAWMLGRFVVPVARLAEFERADAAAMASRGREWRIAGVLGAELEQDIARAREFNAVNAGRCLVDTLEGRLSTVEEIERVGRVAGSEFSVFAELPDDRDLESLIAAIGRSGMRAKLRTGGVTPGAIPSPSSVVRFMRCCLDAGVAFKATAGLHHPIRAEYRLTYDDDAPMSVMYGYLNVFLAGALMADGLSDADALRLLDERVPDAIEVTPDAISWRGHRVSATLAQRARRLFATSFGSCSFREPVDELMVIAHAR